MIHSLIKMTCDEKWIPYDNHKRSAQWLGHDEAPQNTFQNLNHINRRL